MSLYLCVLMVSAGIVGWVWGALKPHRRLWIIILIWPSAAWLLTMIGFYLWAARPTLDNRAELGWPTLVCIILGIGAVISSPKATPPAKRNGAINA